ncbi:MAG: Na+/H+ antiporter NhaC family protein [Oscillospiraceae bacterium]|nr:Na+/H+ antiporter NhaC family protein [Oscillospiraceae bacterium]
MKNQKTNEALIAAFKFLPLLVFALLVIVFKLDLLLAAPIATFAAIIVYLLVNRGSKFEQAFDHGLEAARKIALVFFILMFAYGVAECFMATGVGASLILIALRLGVTARTIAPISILVTCILSVATGSSWGTFAACAPIFLWLNYLVGGDVMLTVCAIAGGSCFGDNIGMISDVTVLSCGLQDVKIIDRIKHQLVWSLGCLAIALVIFFLAGSHLPNEQGDVQEAISRIPPEAYEALIAEDRESAVQLLRQVESGVPYYLVIPMLLIIVTSFLGVHTLLCLGAGMLSSLLLGELAGTVNLHDWLKLLKAGFADAGNWVIVMMMWVAAFGGIMNAMDAFAPLSKLVVRISRSVHGLMGWCGVLCLLGNAALADEAAQVATMSPIVRGIVENNVQTDSEEDAYALRLRLATFTSSMGIYGSELVPWHCFPMFFASIATAVYPILDGGFTSIDIIRHNYLGFLFVGSILLLTFTGWDRFIPGLALPKSARLKPKNTAKAAE